MHDGAVHQAPQVGVIARHAVFLYAQHAVETALRYAYVLLVAKAVVSGAGADAEEHEEAQDIRDAPDVDEAQHGEHCERRKAGAELEVAGEHERRDHRDQQPAERAARRDREIERREMTRRRPRAVELAVAEKATDEHAWQEHAELQREVVVVFGVDQKPSHGHERHQQQRPQEARLVPAFPLEGDDEGGEVQAERHEPEQRHRSHVLRQMIGDRKQQHGSRRREAEPPRVIERRYGHCGFRLT